ncbi:MAG TPA: DinB family protein [Aggregatilineaceae bacterium]|nr:DinB family protein [Aggregatilineaceae bacterium]
MSLITPERYVLALRKTPVVLNALLKGMATEDAYTLTDGPDGWTVIEALCHIRDSADNSLERAKAILEQDNPLLRNLDPAVHNRDFKQQKVEDEWAAYLSARKSLIELLATVTEGQWERRGTHSIYGSLTLLELLVFITWHDLNHIEQIARILRLSDILL